MIQDKITTRQGVIVERESRLMLVPLAKCFGIKFGVFTRKPVVYDMDDYMMLKWTSATCRLFAGIGVEIESPMSRDYTYPSKYPKPLDHQVVTADFLIRNLRSFCLNDIGTAKSLTALWAADYLMCQGLVKKVLICATLSTLNRVWGHEVFSNLMHRTSIVVHGTRTKRLKCLAEDHDFYIVNHEGLNIILPELQKRPDINLVICDEGARFRNTKTSLWKSMHAYAQESTGKGLWWLTGSPMPRSPTDAYGQARIVNPGAVPKYFSRFRDQTMIQINQFKWVPRRGWEDIAYAALKPSIRYHRDDCIDLPDCTYIDHNVAMTPEQVKAYNSLKDEFIAMMHEGLITAANEGVKILKMAQVACGAVYLDNGGVGFVSCAHKLKELDQIITEVGTKLIIFVPFKHSITVITEWLATRKSKVSHGVINGDVGTAKRDEIFTGFQDGDLDLIIAHPAAMAHGLTLTAANTITWFGPVDNYEIYEQANGRITRPGQARKQYIKHLICSPVEKAIYSRLKNKESMQGILLDLIKA